MVRCLPFSACHETNMLHFGHHGRGRLPSYRTTIVSQTWQCTKWIGGRSNLKTSSRNPLLDTPCHTSPEGRISYTTGVLPVVGGGGSLSSPSFPPCTDGSSGTLLLGPLFTQDIRRAKVVFTNGSSLHLVSINDTPL